jgi:hypothetical protein
MSFRCYHFNLPVAILVSLVRCWHDCYNIATCQTTHLRSTSSISNMESHREVGPVLCQGAVYRHYFCNVHEPVLISVSTRCRQISCFTWCPPLIPHCLYSLLCLQPFVKIKVMLVSDAFQKPRILNYGIHPAQPHLPSHTPHVFLVVPAYERYAFALLEGGEALNFPAWTCGKLRRAENDAFERCCAHDEIGDLSKEHIIRCITTQLILGRIVQYLKKRYFPQATNRSLHRRMISKDS